jgi:hypothetical protein
VSPKHGSDIEELNRRRADLAVGWATVEAQNRRRRRHYGLAGTAWAAGLAVTVTAAGLVPVYLNQHGVLAGGTLSWLVPVGMLGTMAVAAGPVPPSATPGSWWRPTPTPGSPPVRRRPP